MRRKVLLSIMVALLLPVLVLTGRALADLSAEEMPLNSAGYAREVNPDAQGNLWISDYSGELWWVSTAGDASKVYSVGGYPLDASPDNQGRVWWVSGSTLSYLTLSDNNITIWTVPGSSYLSGISIDATGVVWMTDAGVANVYSFDINDRDTLCTYPLTDTDSIAYYPFATDNELWLADNGTGALVRLDHSTNDWTRWTLPDLSTPYDVIVDDNGDVWYTDSGLIQLGQFSPATNELSIFPLPIGNNPFMLAANGGRIWYTEQGDATLGTLDPSIAPPTPQVLTPATANVNPSCSRLRNPGGSSVTPVDGTPTWTSGTYPIAYDADGWIIFQLPANSQPHGIAFTVDGYAVDSLRKKLIRFETVPTSVRLVDFTATSFPQAIQLGWSTAQETDLMGFNLSRATTLDAPRVQINPALIPALNPGDMRGNGYQYLDTAVETGKTYYYWVEWIGKGQTELYGPVSALAPYCSWLPSVRR